MVINDLPEFEPPFNSGTVIAIEKAEGRYIRISSQEEAQELANLAQFVADNWNVDS
jgi:hypothetical protein